MKRFLLAAALIFALAVPVLAAGPVLDDRAVIDGMEGISWYQGYEPQIRRDTLTLCWPIRCEGTVTARMELADPDLYLFAEPPKAVTAEGKNGICPVIFTARLAKNRRNGDYPVRLVFSGAAEGTLDYVLPVRDGLPSRETLTPAITGLTARLDAGTETTLSFRLQNPAKTLAMTEVSATVLDAAGQIRVLGPERLAVGAVLPGGETEVTLPLYVPGDAAIALHSLTVTLSYRVLGEPAEYAETHTLPVTQQPRLEPGEAQVPVSAVQGTQAAITLPVMNLGRGALNNVQVRLALPGITERLTVLVGTVEPGQTGQAKLNFAIPAASLGDYTGALTVSGEDAYGSEQSFTLPVGLRVEAAPALKQAETASVSPAAVALGILSGLLAAALIAVSVTLTGRLRKLEEERL